MKHDIVYADYGAEWTHKKEIKTRDNGQIYVIFSLFYVLTNKLQKLKH